MKFWRPILATIIGLITGQIDVTVNINVDVRPSVPVEQSGWAGPDVVAEAAPMVAGMPQFRIVGAEPGTDNTRANVRLWDSVKRVLGDHLPNIPQQTGDCVSFGFCNAADVLQCVRIDKGGIPPSKFRHAFPPYTYGTSRVQIGNRQLGRSAGSIGAWAVAAGEQYGILPADSDNAPPYSGRLADSWGWSGPPQAAIDEAEHFRIRTSAPVYTPDDVRDAVCNGYPVTIASQWGTRTIRVRYDRQVAAGDGSWPHQMCIIGYDGSGPEPLWYVLNSWGPNAHPQPLQGEPPGGFWITERSLRTILSARDSFAISDLDGFPADPIDFTVIGKVAPNRPAKRPNIEHNPGRNDGTEFVLSM